MRTSLITTLGVMGLLAAGCGGGGGDDRLSQEEFREQGNAICTKFDQRIEALDEPTSLEEVPAFVDEAVPIIEEGLAELRALKPPEEDQETFDRMIAQTERALPAAEQVRAAAEKGDAAAVQEALEEGNEADQESDRLATELGLTECAEEDVPTG